MQAEAIRLVTIGLVRNVATLGDSTTHSHERFNLRLDPIMNHSAFFACWPSTWRSEPPRKRLVGSSFLLEGTRCFGNPLGTGGDELAQLQPLLQDRRSSRRYAV